MEPLIRRFDVRTRFHLSITHIIYAIITFIILSFLIRLRYDKLYRISCVAPCLTKHNNRGVLLPLIGAGRDRADGPRVLFVRL